MIYFLIIIISSLAVYRLADLIAIDRISAPLRDAIGRKVNDGKFWYFLAELINCPFCLGIYISALLALIPAHGIIQYLVIWFAIAGGQAFILELVGRHRE